MNTAQIEKMEKWKTFITLMGYSMEQLDEYSNYELPEEDDPMGWFEYYLNFKKILDNPPTVLQFAIRSLEMGVEPDDIRNYISHCEEILYLAQQAEEQAQIDNDPALRKLYDEHAFEFTTGVEYPNHTHFKFNMKDGTPVTGRSFIIGSCHWGEIRIWTYWTDAAGKKHRQQLTVNNHYDIFPKVFPKGMSWDTKTMSLSMAYQLINLSKKSKFNLVKPRR